MHDAGYSGGDASVPNEGFSAVSPITQALLSAIRHSTQPMVLSDPRLPDHPMIAVNAAFERLTQYPASETIGRNCRFLQGAGTDEETRRRIRTALQQHRGCIEWIVNERRDGTVFWNLLFLSPVFDHDGTLLHYFGNQRDITQGPPVELPDYALGKAVMPEPGRLEFHALLLDVLAATKDDVLRAAELDRLVEAARRLDRVTTSGLQPAPWAPP